MRIALLAALLAVTACKERPTASQPEPQPQPQTAPEPQTAPQPQTAPEPQDPRTTARAAGAPGDDDPLEPGTTPASDSTGPGEAQPAAYCAHIERCGCPMEACLDTMAGMISSPPVQDLAGCVTRLPCEAACSDASDHSSPKYTRCVAPIQAALEERGRSIESIRAMTRNVIDNYPGSTRVRNHDETGKYLGESQR
ncbi:MAG: hypothetical protein JNL83_22690 [Myxococcales bacterium]|nr:hypothetical protein [Myxococcales bacterium]